MTSDVLEFVNTTELRGAIVYDNEVTLPPFGSNSTLPRTVWLVEFTNIVCVVHPPPSAKCGMMVPADGAERSTTGSVLMMNCERSFVRPRNAIANTGDDDSKVKVPL